MAQVKKKKSKTQDLYDRIADVQNLAMKINGYRDSVAKYLRSLDLDIKPDSLVLDAGSGTGLVTLALYSAGYRPKKTFALDISYNSLLVAAEQFSEDKEVTADEVETVQGNLLSLPFRDESFRCRFNLRSAGIRAARQRLAGTGARFEKRRNAGFDSGSPVAGQLVSGSFIQL